VDSVVGVRTDLLPSIATVRASTTTPRVRWRFAVDLCLG